MDVDKIRIRSKGVGMYNIYRQSSVCFPGLAHPVELGSTKLT